MCGLFVFSISFKLFLLLVLICRSLQRNKISKYLKNLFIFIKQISMYQYLKIHSDLMKHQHNCIELSSKEAHICLPGLCFTRGLAQKTGQSHVLLPGRYRPGNASNSTGLSKMLGALCRSQNPQFTGTPSSLLSRRRLWSSLKPNQTKRL